MSYDPVHDWLDAAFRKLGGDKKAFTRMKKRNAKTREFRNRRHSTGEVFLGREGVSELERSLNQRYGPNVDLGMMPSQNLSGFPSRNPNPYIQGPGIPQNTSQFDPRMTPGQNSRGFPSGYPSQYNPSSGGPRSQGNPLSTPGSSIRSGMHASKMLVGNMNRTYLEGYEIPSRRHRM